MDKVAQAQKILREDSVPCYGQLSQLRQLILIK